MYAKVSEPLYRVCWYSYETDYDTWEQTRHLPRSKILSYYRTKKLPISGTIDQADDGYQTTFFEKEVDT